MLSNIKIKLNVIPKALRNRESRLQRLPLLFFLGSSSGLLLTGRRRTALSRQWVAANSEIEGKQQTAKLDSRHQIANSETRRQGSCESILQPGNNCTVRIEKNRSKGRRRQKKLIPKAQNNLVYRCHSCSHRNLMRGTPNGYVKEICPPKPKPALKSKKARENCPSLGNATTTIDSEALLPFDGQNLETIAPATPLPATSLSLLESKRRKRNRSSAKNVANPESSAVAADLEKSSHASSKRRKKSWTSLKVIAESSGQDIAKKLTVLTIPFFI